MRSMVSVRTLRKYSATEGLLFLLPMVYPKTCTSDRCRTLRYARTSFVAVVGSHFVPVGADAFTTTTSNIATTPPSSPLLPLPPLMMCPPPPPCSGRRCAQLVYGVMSHVAISAHMMVLKEYGGVTAVLVGNTRKSMTIALSFVLFPKVLASVFETAYTFSRSSCLVVVVVVELKTRF